MSMSVVRLYRDNSVLGTHVTLFLRLDWGAHGHHGQMPFSLGKVVGRGPSCTQAEHECGGWW